MSPGKTEVKQGKFDEFISLAKGYFRETHKSLSGGLWAKDLHHVAAFVIPFNLTCTCSEKDKF